jgi:hypothetical protein
MNPFIGFWVVALFGGDMVQWGKDGGTTEPYIYFADAYDQAAYLAGQPETANCELFILSVRASGQIEFSSYRKASNVQTIPPPAS